MAQGSEYKAVLADLKAQRERLDAAIEAIEHVLGGGLVATGTVIRGGAFAGMKILEASKEYLSDVKRPQTTKQVSDALEQGGVSHQSKNWSNTVRTTLSRLAEKLDSGLVRLDGGQWALADWYPGPNPKKSRGPEEKAARIAVDIPEFDDPPKAKEAKPVCTPFDDDDIPF